MIFLPRYMWAENIKVRYTLYVDFIALVTNVSSKLLQLCPKNPIITVTATKIGP